MIGRDAAKASEYLNRLSDILRYMLYETKAEKIPLAREIAYIEKYLELQKISTTNPDYVNFEVTGDARFLTDNLKIAPIILFPFIENAFKHTESNKRSAAIRIKISIEKNRLVFECENSRQTNLQIKTDYGGLGNELIEKRLMLLYPESHRLEIAADDGIYLVKLTLDL